MVAPRASLEQSPGREHKKRQTRQFDKRQTKSVILAGATEGKRKDQQDHRGYRDEVPLAFPDTFWHALSRSYDESGVPQFSLVAFRVVVGRDNDGRDQNGGTDQEHEDRHTGELGARLCRSADAVPNAGDSGIVRSGSLASDEQQACRYSGDCLTHALFPLIRLSNGLPREISTKFLTAGDQEINTL